MKKFTYLIAAVLLSNSVTAQLFSDNFDTYALASYVGPQSVEWTTWSGAAGEGTTEDVKTTNVQASSGTQSIYFSSTLANGGPQDVILDFGPVYTSGIFSFESDFYINAGKNGYFNFQAAQTPGTTWALNVNMVGGNVVIDDGITADLAIGNYPSASWFNLRIEANLTLGLWSAYVDDVLIGEWVNGINSLASADIFPVQNSQFFMDNVSYDHQTYVLPTLNAMVLGLTVGGNIATQIVDPIAKIKNAGQTTITSFDATLDYDGVQYVENLTGLNLTSLQDYTVTFTGVELVGGANDMVVTISNINGGLDDILEDDVLSLSLNPVVPAAGKMVVGEEGTGTWCQYCPRGAVFMDKYEVEYDGFWAGIAVHGGSASEPMKVPVYDAGIGALISGYPSSLVDRGPEVDPSQMSTDFFQRVQIAPTAFITNGATWDAGTRTLNVSVTSDFQAAANNNYKIACVLTEDGVTGTTSAYAQVNAYANNALGTMGGFESLPNPVPASQMVYDHVARQISPSFEGFANSFPAVVASGEIHTVNFTFLLPATWDETEMHIIGMLIAPNGRIDNASKTTIPEAVTNGLETGTSAGISELNNDQIDAAFKVYPNPATSFALVGINLVTDSEIELKLIDMSGKTVARRNYGTMNGSTEIHLDTRSLESGVYMIELLVNGQRLTERLVVE